MPFTSVIRRAAEWSPVTLIPAVTAATDQEQAIRLARKVDLPALEKANRVVIEEAKIGRDGRRVMLKDADTSSD
jgi:hypothetical protein